MLPNEFITGAPDQSDDYVFHFGFLSEKKFNYAENNIKSSYKGNYEAKSGGIAIIYQPGTLPNNVDTEFT